MYIYIHIPFCSNICKYCDFPKVLYDKKYINKYLETLDREIRERYKGEEVVSIFIGGGTPTSLDYDELERLFKIISIFKRSSNMEFSIESNIESLDDRKIELLKENGVNRVSLGVQSFDLKTLKELNRKHTKEEVFEVINKLKKKKFDNISIDYMYGIDEDIEKVKRDMDLFLELDIPHISCYSLIIEDNTFFGIRNRQYIDDGIDYEMYKYIEEFLESNGYKHYEVSNYSRDGYESLHNLNYWNNGFYYGFGMGSVSYLDYKRISNTKSLSKYIDGVYIIENEEEDSVKRISNGVILGLRKINGVNIEEFNKRYNTKLLKLYNIRELVLENKLVVDDGYLRINKDYFYMANDILINFV